MPDTGMFFPIADYAEMHSPFGVFTSCLPLGIAIFLLFETVMRRPLVALLPIWFQQRITRLPQIPKTPRLSTHLFFYIGLTMAVVIGAFTHQIWDAFTHQGRWGTKLVPSLDSAVAIAGFMVPGYKLFQYGSTLIGLPLLAALALMSLRRVIPDNELAMQTSPKWKRLAALVLCAIPIGVGAYAIVTQSSSYHALGMTIRFSGCIMFLLCVVYCAVFQAIADAETMRNNCIHRNRDIGRF